MVWGLLFLILHFAAASLLSPQLFGIKYNWIGPTNSTYSLCFISTSLTSCNPFGQVFIDSTPTKSSQDSDHPPSAIVDNIFYFYQSDNNYQNVFLTGLSIDNGQQVFRLSIPMWGSLFWQGAVNFITAIPGQKKLLIYGGNNTIDTDIFSASLYSVDLQTQQITQITKPQNIAPIRYGWGVLYQSLNLWLVRLSDGWYGYDINTGEQVITKFNYNITRLWQDIQGPVYNPKTDSIFGFYIDSLYAYYVQWKISTNFASSIQIIDQAIQWGGSSMGVYSCVYDSGTGLGVWVIVPVMGSPNIALVNMVTGNITQYVSWNVWITNYLAAP